MNPIQQWLTENFDRVESGWPDSNSWKFGRYVPKHGNIPTCPEEPSYVNRKKTSVVASVMISLLVAATVWFVR